MMRMNFYSVTADAVPLLIRNKFSCEHYTLKPKINLLKPQTNQEKGSLNGQCNEQTTTTTTDTIERGDVITI